MSACVLSSKPKYIYCSELKEQTFCKVVAAAVSDTARQSNVNGEAGKDGATGKLTKEPKLVVSEL